MLEKHKIAFQEIMALHEQMVSGKSAPDVLQQFQTQTEQLKKALPKELVQSFQEITSAIQANPTATLSIKLAADSKAFLEKLASPVLEVVAPPVRGAPLPGAPTTIAADISKRYQIVVEKELDPVVAAFEKQSDIEGQDPLVWALANAKKIAGKDAMVWIIENEKISADEKNQLIVFAAESRGAIKIEDQDPVAWLAKHNQKIEDQDPIVWAIENNKKISEQNPITWAVDNKKTIRGFDPIVWAFNNKKNIAGKDPIEWAVNNGKEIEALDPLSWYAQKISTKAGALKTKEVLGKHFEDKAIAPQKVFPVKSKKPSGVSDGYIAKRDSDGHLFMLKKAVKGVAGFNEMNLVNEFVSAPLYRRFLYNRAPIIEGVTADNPSEAVYLRSKFFNEFQTVAQFTGSAAPNGIGPDSNKLKNIKGAEKLFAAMLAGGEYDVHPGNIGVSKIDGEMVFTKIDHGWSATQFFSDPNAMLKNFSNAYSMYTYNGKIPLNLTAFKNSIAEFSNISEQEIENFVGNRIHLLKGMGLDVTKIYFPTWENDTSHSFANRKPLLKRFNSTEELTEHYISHYKQHFKALQGFKEKLEIIEKISPSSPDFQNGNWIKEMGGRDPIAWAAVHNKLIENQKPIDWALQKQQKIEDLNPIVWAVKNGQTIEGQNPIVWAISKHQDPKIIGEAVTSAFYNNKQIEGQDPLVWAISNKQSIAGIAPKDFKQLLDTGTNMVVWAAENNRQIDGQDPLAWAHNNSARIAGRSVMTYAITNEKKIEGKDPSVWMMDHAELESNAKVIDYSMSLGKQIEGKDPIVWAIDKQIYIGTADPIIWAVDNHKKIEGKDPLVWAVEHDKQIDNKDPVVWAVEDKKQIEGKDPIVWAVEHKKQIDNKDPVVWAIEEKKQIEGKDPVVWAVEDKKQIEGKDPIVWTAEKGQKIDNKDPVIWALDSNRSIQGLDPIAWAVNHKKNIAGKDPLLWAHSNNKKIEGLSSTEWEINRINQKGRIKEAKEVLGKHFEDKAILSEAKDFIDGKQKDFRAGEGISGGKFVKRKSDMHKHILKHAYKSEADIPVGLDKRVGKQHSDDRRDMVTEYLLSGVYQLALYDRAPKNELVSKDSLSIDTKSKNWQKDTAREVHLRSKFFDNFQTIGEFTGGKGFKLVDTTKLTTVEGFEKVIAACISYGEYDYHAGNIGVIKSGPAGQEKFTAVKIDHGRSGANFYSSPDLLRKELADHLQRSYQLNEGHLKLNAGELKKSLDEMLKISEEEIDQQIKAKCDNLRRLGVDISGISFLRSKDDKVNTVKIPPYDARIHGNDKAKYEYEALGNHFKKQIVQQQAMLRKFSAELAIIEKIDGNEAFKKGGWLSEISGSKDIIAWAIKNDKKIDKKNPIVWAIKNDKKIEGKDPLDWAAENNRLVEGKDPAIWAMDKGQKIGGKDPIVWAAENNRLIEWEKPLDWAAENNRLIEGKNPAIWAVDKGQKIEGKDPMVWAMDKGQKIGGKDPMVWAAENNRLIEGKNPVVWAIENNKKIEGKAALDWAMEQPNLGKGKDRLAYMLELKLTDNNPDMKKAIKQAVDKADQTKLDQVGMAIIVNQSDEKLLPKLADLFIRKEGLFNKIKIYHLADNFLTNLRYAPNWEYNLKVLAELKAKATKIGYKSDSRLIKRIEFVKQDLLSRHINIAELYSEAGKTIDTQQIISDAVKQNVDLAKHSSADIPTGKTLEGSDLYVPLSTPPVSQVALLKTSGSYESLRPQQPAAKVVKGSDYAVVPLLPASDKKVSSSSSIQLESPESKVQGKVGAKVKEIIAKHDKLAAEKAKSSTEKSTDSATRPLLSPVKKTAVPKTNLGLKGLIALRKKQAKDERLKGQYKVQKTSSHTTDIKNQKQYQVFLDK